MIFIYTSKFEEKCISLGFKHCNRYKAKIKICCKVLSCLLWNDPRLDFFEVNEEQVLKLLGLTVELRIATAYSYYKGVF